MRPAATSLGTAAPPGIGRPLVSVLRLSPSTSNSGSVGASGRTGGGAAAAAPPLPRPCGNGDAIAQVKKTDATRTRRDLDVNIMICEIDQQLNGSMLATLTLKESRECPIYAQLIANSRAKNADAMHGRGRAHHPIFFCGWKNAWRSRSACFGRSWGILLEGSALSI